MSIELTGKIEVRSRNGEVLELDCLYDSSNKKVAWVFSDENDLRMTWERFQEIINEYMDKPVKDQRDGGLTQILLIKNGGSSDMCVPESLFKKMPKYPHELVQQALAISE